jgi:formate hydrogenlyase subunit 6/NADH:ubiquinone oxidoreductase subunit I
MKNLIRQRMSFYPEKCSGCMLCAMTCSLRYDGIVNPLKARTKIHRKNNITERITLTKECTFCGHCINACNYGARFLIPIE